MLEPPEGMLGQSMLSMSLCYVRGTPQHGVPLTSLLLPPGPSLHSPASTASPPGCRAGSTHTLRGSWPQFSIALQTAWLPFLLLLQPTPSQADFKFRCSWTLPLLSHSGSGRRGEAPDTCHGNRGKPHHEEKECHGEFKPPPHPADVGYTTQFS